MCGPNGIDAVNVSNPADPVDEGTFGASLIHQGGLTVGRFDEINGTPYLIVGTTVVGIVSGGAPPFALLIFNLSSNPSNPRWLATRPSTTDSSATWSSRAMAIRCWCRSTRINILYGFEFIGQTGNVIAIDVSTPSQPEIAGGGTGVLFGSTDPNAATAQYGVTLVNSQYAYVASSTANDGRTQNGEGRVVIVNYSNPADMTYTEVDIPGTYQILTVGVEGDQVIAVGRTGGDTNDDNNGTMTLTLLTITTTTRPI